MKTQLTTSAIAHTLQLKASGLTGLVANRLALTNGQLGAKAVDLSLPAELFPFIQPGDTGLVVILSVVRIGIDEVVEQPTSGIILPGTH